jgi:essential nuclear protein 1
MPAVKKSSSGKSRHNPLLIELDKDEIEARYGRVSQPGRRKKSRKEGLDHEEVSEESPNYGHVTAKQT